MRISVTVLTSPWSFILFFVCLRHCNVTCDASDSQYINVALNRPVTIYPTDSTCGIPEAGYFCKSYPDPQSITNCSWEWCDLSCPVWYYTQGNPQGFLSVLDYLVLGAWERTCVQHSGTFLRPGSPSNGFSARFLSGSSSCYLDADQSYLGTIRNYYSWNMTIDMWMYVDMDGKTGTIMEFANSASQNAAILTIYIDKNVIKLKSGSQSMTESSWAVPSRQWTHLAISVFSSSVTIYINGIIAPPSEYNLQLSSSRSIDSLRIGQSFTDTSLGHFVGYLSNIRVWYGSLTNIEIGYLYNGKLSTDGLAQPSCSCPSQYPAFSPDDSTQCVQNPGSGRDSNLFPRLKPSSHPPEFVNDGKDSTFWLSSVKTNRQINTIAITLDDIYQVLAMEILFYSPLPREIKYYRKYMLTDSWSNWGFGSGSCTGGNSISCIPYESGSQASQGLVRVTLTQTDVLSTWVRAVNISFEGYVDNLSTDHKYHGVYEIRIIATCACFGAGSVCKMVPNSGYQCICAPSSLLTGDKCDTCSVGYYRDSVQKICRPCDCNTAGVTAGTQGANLNCRLDDGQCNCKLFVSGRRCDTCSAGYFNLTADNAYGCQLCDCQKAGTVNGSSVCNQVTGECLCKDNVEGKSCNKCKAGFYSLQASNPTGCTPCNCNPAGSKDLYTCNDQTGECTCKELVLGRACDKCRPRAYNLTKSNALGCTTCDCDPNGAVTDSSTVYCNDVTGQCTCKPNVTGRRCDSCLPNLYAFNEADLYSNGCTRPCNCYPNGTVPDQMANCSMIGGQCPCRSSDVRGRACDSCRDLFYWTGSSVGCEDCACSQTGSMYVQCDPYTGMCRCKANTQLRDCSGCKQGYYGLSDRNPDGCVPCNCNTVWTRNGTICDPISGQCDCIAGDGEKGMGGTQCDPYVANFFPSYGPASGGTFITIKVGFFSVKDATVVIDTKYCPIDMAASRPSALVCIAPPMDDKQLLNTPLLVRVLINVRGNYIDYPFINGSNRFTYKTDPVVAYIKPLNIFESGGIEMMIFGTDINSVAIPVIVISMVYTKDGNTTVTTFTSPCVRVDFVLTCRFPEIILPSELEDTSSYNPGNQLARGRRVRRAVNTDPLNGNVVQFYAGVQMDGITLYKNITSINVFYNPIVYNFPEKDKVRLFRQYWPYSDKVLSIQGERFGLGAAVTDYTILVGNESCTLISFTDNLITCLPPEHRPATDGPYDKPGIPAVTIYVGNFGALAGFLDYRDRLWEDNTFKYCVTIIPAVVVAIILILIIACLLRRSDYCKALRDRKKRKERETLYMGDKMTPDTGNPKRGNYYTPFSTIHRELSPILSKLPRKLRERIEKCLIDEKNVEVKRLIGEGHFGQVYEGELTDNNAYGTWKIPVALKTIKEFDASKLSNKEVKEFLEEATLMHDLSHGHVLSLVGVILSRNHIYVVLPYMDKGDLENFVSNPENILTVKQLIEFSLQVAYGMSYLEEKNCVHRDLACRNCMINSELVVKISDFGLAHDMHGKDYYRVRNTAKPMPVKWMALESLETGVFSSKSDVWSFGVLIWELMTRGCSPYPEIEHKDIKEHLSAGNRLPQPSYAPDELYTIMMQCWHITPSKRPSFLKLSKQIDKFIKSSVKQEAATAPTADSISKGDSSNPPNTYLELIADVPDYVNVKRSNLKTQISSRSDYTTTSGASIVDSGHPSSETEAPEDRHSVVIRDRNSIVTSRDRNSVITSGDSCYKSFTNSSRRSIYPSTRSRSVTGESSQSSNTENTDERAEL